MGNRIKNYLTEFYHSSVERNREAQLSDFELEIELELAGTGDSEEDEAYALELQKVLDDHRRHSEYIIDSLQLSGSGLEALFKSWYSLCAVEDGLALYRAQRGCQGVKRCSACRLLEKISVVMNSACKMIETYGDSDEAGESDH